MYPSEDAQIKAELTKKAIRNALVFQGIKWAAIIGITRSLQKAVEKEISKR